MVSIAEIDLNLLHVLHVVLEERNVARAAERLHVTASAVSNALARLRDALGDPLVTRKGRGIVPTPRAQELAPVIARALEDLSRAVLAAPFDAARCDRTFTLAVADVGQIAWVPRLVVAMERALPRAHLRVIGIDSMMSLGDLGSPEIDVHVGIAARGPGIHGEPLVDVRNVLVAGRAHRRTRVTRAALAGLRHVRVDLVPGKRFADPFAAVFARAGLPREVVMTVPSFLAALEVVAATSLVAMVPSPLLAAKGRSLGLRALSTPLPPHAISFAMSWHERTDADPAGRAFRALVRSSVRA